MKDLKKLIPVSFQDMHDHILFIDEENGEGWSSIDANHTHEVSFIPPTPEKADAAGNIIIPATEGGWEVTPGPDGHVHEIGDYIVGKSKSKKKGKKDEVVKEVYEYLRLGIETQGDSIEKGKESLDFYFGKQWEDADKRHLEGIDRAALTINVTQPKVDRLSGYERGTRTEFKYIPVEESDGRVADLYSLVAKHIQYRSNYKREKSKVFMDVVRVGRGAFNVYVDHANDILGEGKIESFKWDDFLTGPHLKEDLEDCEWIIKHRMYSKERIEALWPKIAKKLGKTADIMMEEVPSGSSYVRGADNYEISDSTFPVIISDLKICDLARKEYRVLELWRRKYQVVPVAVNAESDAVFDLSDWEVDDIERVKTVHGFLVIERPQNKIRITRVVGNQLISDEDPAEIPSDDFHLVPAYCYKNDEQFFGKIEGAKDPQRQINHRSSQLVDIGNKMIAYGWFYDSTTFPQGQEKKFQRIASKPGFLQKITSVSKPPQQVEGIKFPAEVAQLLSTDMDLLGTVLNMTVEEGGANESGAHLLHREKDKLGGNQFIFDAVNDAQEKVGRLILGIIQKYYSPERIYRIVSGFARKEAVMVGDKPFEEFPREEIIEILSNTEAAKFDVIVTDAASSPSARNAIFIVLSDLLRSGVPVPPELLIEYMDSLSESTKRRVLDTLAQQQEAELEAQKAVANAEIEKTLIAQGVMTPTAQRLIQESNPEGIPPENTDPSMNGISQF